VGEPVPATAADGDFEAGDLLFFGEKGERSGGKCQHSVVQ
jgi:hypothetical protein